jgi:hypothetical protein
MLDLVPWFIAAIVLVALIVVVRGLITRAERAARAMEALRTRGRRFRVLAEAAPVALVGVEWSRFFWREAARAYGEMRAFEALNPQDAAAFDEIRRALESLSTGSAIVEAPNPPETEAVETRRGLNAALATVARLVEAGDVSAERARTIHQALTYGIVRSRLGSWMRMAVEARTAGDHAREAEHWRRAETDAGQLEGDESVRLATRFAQEAHRAEVQMAAHRAAQQEAARAAAAEARATGSSTQAPSEPPREAPPAASVHRRPSLGAELTIHPPPEPDIRAPFPVSSRRR